MEGSLMRIEISRKHKDYYPSMYRMLLPAIFWTKCESCITDFRFVRGWKAFDGRGLGSWLYICPTCAPDKDKASEKFFERDKAIKVSKPTEARIGKTGIQYLKPQQRPKPKPPKASRLRN